MHPFHNRSCILLLFATLLIMSCEPLSTANRDLNGTWQFKYDPDRVGLRDGWPNKGFDRSDWGSLAVPGFWDDETYDGFAWYATKLQVDQFPSGYKLALVFDSIDDNAFIWLDGHLFGKQIGYGEKFFLDIGYELADGEPHDLVIRIEDLGGPGGINGAVYMQSYLNETDLLRSEASKSMAPPAPAWVRDAVIYEVFVRQYSKAGTFAALTADLDRIKELGVDLIWLMPVHPTGRKNAKGSLGSPYAVRDYYAVAEDLGTLKDLQDLVQAVHARGMHIILDFVINHTAWDNELITTHPEWYSHDAAGKIISPNTDWYDVADLNYAVPELRAYMDEMLTWWLREMDIDGFRFDVAELVPNDFWNTAKAACQAVKPDVFFLAEGARPELHLNGHDMTYSWNIWEGMIQVAQGLADPSEVKRSYEMEQYQYPQGALRMRFSENHDKTRSAAYLKDVKLNRTTWAFMALMDGNPLIYAGQEVGATRKPDLFEKDAVNWKSGDQGMSAVMSDLIQLRRTYLKSSSPFQIIIADNEKRIMAYRHGPLLAFFNFSADTFKFSAAGMEEILYGGLSLNADSTLALLPKDFGVIK